MRRYEGSFSGLVSTLRRAKTASILLTLGGVLIFQSLLEQSGLLPKAGEDLVASGIPLVVVIALLPFVAGFVTGIAIGFAGTAFPIVNGLIQADASGLFLLSTIVLAFGFGYAGMMLSPVHLCFVLTRDYFSASFRDVYRQMALAILVFLAASILLYVGLRSVGI